MTTVRGRTPHQSKRIWGRIEMNRYDIVFIGQMGVSKIVPFRGSPFNEEGSPLLFAAVAASCQKKQTAAVTRITTNKEYLLEPLKNAGVDLFIKPGEIYEYEVVFPTANVDQRKITRIKVGEPFSIGNLPPIEPCLIHLCCIGGRSFNIDLARALKAMGFGYQSTCRSLCAKQTI